MLQEMSVLLKNPIPPRPEFSTTRKFLLLILEEPDGSAVASERMSFLALMHPALVAAIFHLIPNAFPLLAPRERAAAGEADFLRKMLLFNALHAWVINSATVSAMI